MPGSESANKVLVIGATGFTGRRVLHSLSRRPDVHVTCLLREGSELVDVPEGMTVTVVRGNLDQPQSLAKVMADKDGLIYVASLGFGHAGEVVKAAENAKLKKCVFTSTTAIFTKLNAPSKKARKAAEDTIMHSSLNWTIIRPTMIYGRKGDRNMERLVKYLKRLPIILTPGTSKALQQPNFVDDVAGALVAAYFNKNSSCKAYDISGPEPISFKHVVKTIGNALDKKILLIELPLTPCLWVVRQYETLMYYLKLKPFIKAEQLLRLNENKIFSHETADRDFGYHPHSFEEGIQTLVKELSDD